MHKEVAYYDPAQSDIFNGEILFIFFSQVGIKITQDGFLDVPFNKTQSNLLSVLSYFSCVYVCVSLF